jgi:tRNA threonylcarbamoyladenosine biosynthesis protein TsaE
VVALDGPLGAGKTTFVQGIFKALGLRRRATSPTFILVRRFPLSSRRTPFRELYHVDLYRVRGIRGARAAGLREALRSPEALVLVEWARGARMKSAMRVRFAHGRHARERIIDIRHGTE